MNCPYHIVQQILFRRIWFQHLASRFDNAFQQRVDGNVKCICNLQACLQTWVRAARFDTRNVLLRRKNHLRQFFLRQMLLVPECTDILAEPQIELVGGVSVKPPRAWTGMRQ